MGRLKVTKPGFRKPDGLKGRINRAVHVRSDSIWGVDQDAIAKYSPFTSGSDK